MIGLLATLIAAIKRHTLFAIFSGILSTLNIYATITYGWDFWLFGWILFIISVFMKTKVEKKDESHTVVIREVAQSPSNRNPETVTTPRAAVFCPSCGECVDVESKFCKFCGTKLK